MAIPDPPSSSPSPSSGAGGASIGGREEEWLVVVSNRLPVTVEKNEEGHWEIGSSSGGLVTALEPVLKKRGGVWVGWPGTTEEIPEMEKILAENAQRQGYNLRAVHLSEEEKENFYHGFSNEIIWPLFHGFHGRCNFDLRYWESYREVNRKFAEAVVDSCRENDFIWVQDYHLMGVADEIQKLTGHDESRRIGFFLHIPFPHPEVLEILPWYEEVLQSLVRFDFIGFQTDQDRTNFLACLEVLAPGEKRRWLPALRRQPVRSGVFPVSIDWEAFAEPEEEPEIEARMNELLAEDPVEKIILGVDRLDYTKGIPHKLRGYRRALELYPELLGRVKLVQLIVPSRENIDEYQSLKIEIERLVGEINGEFTSNGWVPIHYLYRSWERTELLAYYRAAHIGLVTSLKDGMNLVAKEFCAANVDGDAVLILSRFAGVAEEFEGQALTVNPYDVEEIARELRHAVSMPVEERKRRMAAMREGVRSKDTYWWVDSFLRSTKSARRPRRHPAGTPPGKRDHSERRGTGRRAARRLPAVGPE